MNNKLPVTEELDFHYLLSIMPVLRNISEYTWLPELFSIIGYEKLITLCKYAGGEIIKIPTIDELSDSIESLQWFYDVYISHKLKPTDIPSKHRKTVSEIRKNFKLC